MSHRPKLRKGDIVELEIEGMAFGGKGVARSNGFVVFVKGGITGDKLKGKIYKKKRNYAEADLIELIAPSKERIQAPCSYFGFCGGCQWQQANYKSQLSFKRNIVGESISKISNLPEIYINKVIPSEKIFAYRNKMEFSFCDRRWLLPEEMDKKESESRFALGLHVPGTYYKVIDVEKCLLQNDTGNKILGVVKQYVKNSGIPVYGLKTHKGFWRFLTLRYSVYDDKWMVNIVTSDYRSGIMRPLAELLNNSFDQIGTIVNNITAKKSSTSIGEREIVLAGKGFIRDKIGEFCFHISSNSFFQTNSPAAQRLYETVALFAELDGSQSVLDLYSGTGTIPIFLAKKASHITGIEISESAILDARRNCEENNISNCGFICGDMREELARIHEIPDVIIIDPPRAGMHKDVLSKVLEMNPGKIVYVSCNPTTMARDVALMSSDYNIEEIQPVDMFPHTYHIESVAKLTRRKL